MYFFLSLYSLVLFGYFFSLSHTLLLISGSNLQIPCYSNTIEITVGNLDNFIKVEAIKCKHWHKFLTL